MTPDDGPAIRGLLAEVYRPPRHGPDAIWPEQSLQLHLSIFPQGQFVAIDQDGRLVGTSTSMRVALYEALSPHTWHDITGRGTISTHDPQGDALYGINIAVVPGCQGHGIGSALYSARFGLARALGCRAFVAGARIPGYAANADRMPPEEYLEKVVAGELFDPTLSKQLKLGFSVCGLLKDYSADKETLDYAALICKEM